MTMAKTNAGFMFNVMNDSKVTVILYRNEWKPMAAWNTGKNASDNPNCILFAFETDQQKC